MSACFCLSVCFQRSCPTLLSNSSIPLSFRIFSCLSSPAYRSLSPLLHISGIPVRFNLPWPTSLCRCPPLFFSELSVRRARASGPAPGFFHFVHQRHPGLALPLCGPSPPVTSVSNLSNARHRSMGRGCISTCTSCTLRSRCLFQLRPMLSACTGFIFLPLSWCLSPAGSNGRRGSSTHTCALDDMHDLH